MLLHALWNGSLAFAGDAVGLYFTVQVPIFLGAVLLTVLLRRQEVRITRARLAEYGAAGWFSPAEVEMLATPAGRRQARAWARAQTPPRTALMRKLITDATHLAFTRQRMLTGRDGGARRSTSTHCCRPSRPTGRRCSADRRPRSPSWWAPARSGPRLAKETRRPVVWHCRHLYGATSSRIPECMMFAVSARGGWTVVRAPGGLRLDGTHD